MFFLSLAHVTSDKPDTRIHVLVLGMVRLTSKAFDRELRTQLNSNREAHGPLRDEIRLRHLERLSGCVIHTVSQMEIREKNYFASTHIQATVSDSSSSSRGFTGILRSHIKRTHGPEPFFKAVFVDWVRMPGPYFRQICDVKFFSKVLVDLVQDKWIAEGTPLYVPVSNAKVLEDAQRQLVSKGYSLCIRDIESHENSLWEATNLAAPDLENIDDPNRNQLDRGQMFQLVTLLSGRRYPKRDRNLSMYSR